MSPQSDTRPLEAYRGDEPFVFVSYSHRDVEAVHAELVILNKLGINVWYDEGISPGSQWTDELAERIVNCTLFLYLVTPRSVASQNCQDEANFALEKGKPFLAVHLEKTELPAGLMLRMGTRQAIHKYLLDQASYERKLHAALTARSPKAVPAGNELSRGFRVGDFDVDPLGGTLRSGDSEPVRLEPKVMDVLVTLASHANEIVTREQILNAVWTGQVAADELLTRAISELRRAFGDNPADPKYIVTVPKRGYRLCASVTVLVPNVDQAGGSTISDAAPTFVWRVNKVAGLAILAALFAFAAVWFSLDTPEQNEIETVGKGDIPFQTAARPRPLTSLEGYELDPAVSPDGNYVAFIWETYQGEDVSRDLYGQETASGTTIRLTETPEFEQSPAWSPDGTQLVFFRCCSNGSHEIIRKPLIGQNETILGKAGKEVWGLDWSPNGDQIAFAGNAEFEYLRDYRISILTIATGETETLESPTPDVGEIAPKFSPDGRLLAFLQASSDIRRICIRDLVNGESRCLTPDDESWWVWDIDWAPDSESIVAVIGGNRGGVNSGRALFRVSTATNEPVMLPFGDNASTISVSRFGRRLVYSHEFRDLNLWRVSGPNAANPIPPAKLDGMSTYDEMLPVYSPDGTKLAFVSARSGRLEVWLAGADGSNPRQLSRMGHANHPQWSPDGSSIVFDSLGHLSSANNQHEIYFRQNKRAVYAVEPTGTAPKMITVDEDHASRPSMSLDGQWLYFQGEFKECGYNLYKKNIETGEIISLANCAQRPLEGANGRVYFIYKTEGIRSVSSDGGESRLEFDERNRGCLIDTFGWTIWDSNLIYIDCQDRKIELYDFQTGETRELADVFIRESLWNSGLDVSPDGQWITYTRLDGAGSDLMLIESFQ